MDWDGKKRIWRKRQILFAWSLTHNTEREYEHKAAIFHRSGGPCHPD